jgi:hypothetical protein
MFEGYRKNVERKKNKKGKIKDSSSFFFLKFVRSKACVVSILDLYKVTGRTNLYKAFYFTAGLKEQFKIDLSVVLLLTLNIHLT